MQEGGKQEFHWNFVLTVHVLFSRFSPAYLTESCLCTYQCNAGVGGEGVGGGGEGSGWGGDLTFFKNLQSNSLPTDKSFQSNETKFPHPGLHIAVIYPKAGPKKGTIKISPNKTLQSFINVAASPKIHVPVTAAIIRFNHNPCYTA